MKIDRGGFANWPIPSIIQAILFSFLISGALYLFFPEQHYNVGGWGVLVKYIIYIFLLGALSVYALANKPLSIAAVLIGISWIVAALVAIIAGAQIDRVLLYLIPVSALLAPPTFQEKAVKLAFPVLLVTCAGALYEYFVLGGFARFHPTSYRGISIFINPNNLGIVATILAAYCALSCERWKRWLAMFLCGALILYSGSKTGMATYVILAVLLIARNNLVRMITLGLPIVAVAAAAVAIGIVKVPLASSWERLVQYADFFTNVDNIVFPFLDGRVYYADNAYIQLWIELGLPSVIVYVAVMLLCAVKERLNGPLWVIFMFASVTTNIPYLFPLAYIFWFHVGTVMRRTIPVIGQRIDEGVPSR